jgi:hypothetical protein
MLRFPDASLDMPWGRDTAEDVCGPRIRRAGHQQGRSCPDQTFDSTRPGLQGMAR